MMPPALAFALLLTLLAATGASAQQELSRWAFGNNAGLDFRTTPPRSLSSPVRSFEGSASIADASGELLFSTDGTTLYNRLGQPMPNGSGLSGSPNSTQSALILPAPGRAGTYYLFTTDAGPYDPPSDGGLRYSVIDMTLDGGLGDVTLRDQPLLLPATEKLTAIPDAEGCGYWVLGHAVGSNAFHAWLLDRDGLDTVAVISNVGSVHDPGPFGTGTMGAMKGSADGTRLAVAGYTSGTLELFRFDRATGVVSDQLSLPGSGYDYGLSFSPSGRFLYVSTSGLTGFTPTEYRLLQYDLSAGDSGAIAARRVLLQEGDAEKRRFGFLQLAPDGRIYMALQGGNALGVIEEPDLAGSAASYRHASLVLDSGRSTLGLPNMVDALVTGGTDLCTTPTASFDLSDTLLCAGSCLVLTDRSTGGPTDWRWTIASSDSTWTIVGRSPGPVCSTPPGRLSITLEVANARGRSSTTRRVEVRAGGLLELAVDDRTVAPGEVVEIFPRLVTARDVGPGRRLLLELAWSPSILRFGSIEPTGSALQGWTLTTLERNDSTGVMRLEAAPPAGDVVDAGELLPRLVFSSHLSSEREGSIIARLTAADEAGGCVTATGDTAAVRLELCGIGTRMIEVGGFDRKFELQEVMERSSASATLTLPFDEAPRLRVVDLLGITRATVEPGRLAAGSHMLALPVRSLAAGVYVVVVEAGWWRETREIVLR